MKILVLNENKDEIKLLETDKMHVREVDVKPEYSGEYKPCLDKLHKLLENMPEHWITYVKHKKFDGLINMQIEELMEAKRVEDMEKMKMEYLHAAAAFLVAYHYANRM